MRTPDWLRPKKRGVAVDRESWGLEVNGDEGGEGFLGYSFFSTRNAVESWRMFRMCLRYTHGKYLV